MFELSFPTMGHPEQTAEAVHTRVTIILSGEESSLRELSAESKQAYGRNHALKILDFQLQSSENPLLSRR
jgi:hypothetical protein